MKIIFINVNNFHKWKQERNKEKILIIFNLLKAKVLHKSAYLHLVKKDFTTTLELHWQLGKYLINTNRLKHEKDKKRTFVPGPRGSPIESCCGSSRSSCLPGEIPLLSFPIGSVWNLKKQEFAFWIVIFFHFSPCSDCSFIKDFWHYFDPSNTHIW